MKADILLLILLFSLSVFADKVAPNATIQSQQKTCIEDQERQKQRSDELQKIVAEDQADRTTRPIDWNKVGPRDMIRIKRVGEIFAEGCIVQAKDYAAAALVFQHGDHPDHYLQVYLWQKRAVELGDKEDHPDLMYSGIDRYLVSIGRRQLFATQYGKMKKENCRCLQAIEESFPEKRRTELTGRALNKAFAFVKEGNLDRPACAEIRFCDTPLLPTTKADLPFTGLW